MAVIFQYNSSHSNSSHSIHLYNKSQAEFVIIGRKSPEFYNIINSVNNKVKYLRHECQLVASIIKKRNSCEQTWYSYIEFSLLLCIFVNRTTKILPLHQFGLEQKLQVVNGTTKILPLHQFGLE